MIHLLPTLTLYLAGLTLVMLPVIPPRYRFAAILAIPAITLLGYSYSPAIVLILGGVLLPAIAKSQRGYVALVFPLITLALVWLVDPVEGEQNSVHFAGFVLHPLYIHTYTQIFATIFSLAAFAGTWFSLRQKDVVELSSALVYAGGAIGVTFSGDFITLFLYWEIMAIASTIVVLCGRTNKSCSAGLRYAAMHFFGGIVLLTGIIAYVVGSNNILLSPLSFHFSALFDQLPMNLELLGKLLILVGVLVNAAAPPFSSWLPDAYPESSPTGAVFLSAFTTKTAVFVLLTLFNATSILIPIGIFMIFYGIIYAMLENDMRRILAYSIVNQVGFMVTGVGIGTELAQFGVATHAFSHIIYKALLLMSAGSVMFMTGKRKCTDLGGLYQSMPVTTLCGIIGALAISAFPWTSGFVSKSMITSAAASQYMPVVWFMLVAASAGVFLHAGIKFPWFVFFQKDSGMRPDDPPASMQLSMLFMAGLCILPGLFPEYLYKMLPHLPVYEPYTFGHVVTQLQLLLFAGLAFFTMLPFLQRTLTLTLDVDWIYRVLLHRLYVLSAILLKHMQEWAGVVVRHVGNAFYNVIYGLHGSRGSFSRNWAIGNTVLYTTALLGIILILYYVGVWF